VDPDALRNAESPGQLLAGWIQEAGLPPLPSIASAAWKGTAPLTRQASRFSAERVMALGDARGYVEPFTGEGMAWALESAHQAAALAANALDQCGRGLEERWQVMAQRQMRQRPLWCRAVARTLRSPKATRVIVSMLDFFPGLASPIVARMNTDTRS
jgi:flavin-dependent dehydrogenase